MVDMTTHILYKFIVINGAQNAMRWGALQWLISLNTKCEIF